MHQEKVSYITLIFFYFDSGLQQKKVSLEVQFHPDFDFVTAVSIRILSGDTRATSAHFAIIIFDRNLLLRLLSRLFLDMWEL